MSHSQTPFTKNPKNGRIIMAADKKIATCNATGPQAWEDAQFIMQACNCFDDFLKLCVTLENDLRQGAYGHDQVLALRALIKKAGGKCHFPE
jgi:hypothetical protein